MKTASYKLGEKANNCNTVQGMKNRSFGDSADILPQAIVFTDMIIMRSNVFALKN